jgi:hypothetical protein
MLAKKKIRSQIFNIELKTKKKLYIQIIKSFLKKIKNKKNNYSFIIKKKIYNIVINKSPHVNVKAKRKYIDIVYLIFLKNIETKFYNVFKKIILSDTRYIFLKKIV